MTDPLGILADHLQGLADQVAAALQAARAMQAERNEPVDFQPLTHHPDIRSDDLNFGPVKGYRVSSRFIVFAALCSSRLDYHLPPIATNPAAAR